MSPPGLRLEVSAEFSRVLLHFVDVQHLEDISRDESLSADEREIICSVRELVGYGINGGKRVYVGYVDERKTAQRKIKRNPLKREYFATLDTEIAAFIRKNIEAHVKARIDLRTAH